MVCVRQAAGVLGTSKDYHKLTAGRFNDAPKSPKCTCLSSSPLARLRMSVRRKGEAAITAMTSSYSVRAVMSIDPSVTRNVCTKLKHESSMSDSHAGDGCICDKKWRLMVIIITKI